MEQRFGLVQAEENFFPEWHEALPELNDREQERLLRVRAAYENLTRRSILESTVKLAIVSPLLDLAGLFFRHFISALKKR